MGCVSLTKKSISVENKYKTDEFSVLSSNYIKLNTKEFSKVYSVGRPLGKGSSGEVRFCTHNKTGSLRAVKIFNKNTLMSTESKKNFLNEVNILKILDHPNIIRVYEFFEDLTTFYIIMEYCRGGELFDEMIKEKKYTEKECAQIMKQIFSCISYTHTLKIAHRDIKPENILFYDRFDYQNIKLIDFGSASFFSRNKKMKGGIGTPYYVAPEVIKGNYTEKCDLWSAGVMLYILITGIPPFNGNSNKEIFKSIIKISYNQHLPSWTNASEEVKDLIANLLLPEAQRLSAEEALSHPWIKKHTMHTLNKKLLSHTFLNLTNFEAKSKIKDAVRTFIASQIMSSEETMQAKETFRSLDENSDGKLSKEELISGYSKIMDEEEAKSKVEEIMKQLNSDNDGYIEYSEFLKAAVDNEQIMSEINLKNAFEIFDKDGRGKISTKDLKIALQGDKVINDDLWEQIIKQFHGSISGEIDLKEFQEYLSVVE